MMKSRVLHRSVALATVSFVLSIVSIEATATAQRTFVASTGNDATACSLAQPCRAFARAITQTNAGGEVIVLDSAGYGPVTITKSISLIAPAGIYAGITVFSGDGITINAPGATVVLRGLSINGQGGSNGVNVLGAARVRIESCVISGMNIDGVMHSAAGAELIVLDTIVRDNFGSGIGGDADASVVLDHVRSEHNRTNGFYLASLSGDARVMISDSVFAHNGSNGIWVAATNTGRTTAQVERSVLANNLGAGVKINSTIVSGVIAAVVSHNAVHGNAGDGVEVTGPNVAFSGCGVFAIVSDNAFYDLQGVHVDGIAACVEASANTGRTTFVQSNAATIWTYGNNAGTSFPGSVLSLSLK